MKRKNLVIIDNKYGEGYNILVNCNSKLKPKFANDFSYVVIDDNLVVTDIDYAGIKREEINRMIWLEHKYPDYYRKQIITK